MHSAFMRLQSRDWLNGLLIAIGAPILAKLAEVMHAPGFDFIAYDWKSLIAVGISGGAMYILKNFLSDETGTFLGGFRKFQ